jgi:peptide/nickel transport system permease protein
MAKFFSGRVPEMTILGRTFSGSVVVIVLIIGLTSLAPPGPYCPRRVFGAERAGVCLAARATGTPNWQIIFWHILPNTVAPIVVTATLSVAGAILSEAYISFLGMGVQPPTATWGNMVTGATNYIETAPWVWFFPSILILLTVLSINFRR